jgi:hypothetical protein
MKPTFNAVRAVGVEFVRRSLRPLVIAGVVAAVVLLAVGGWLTTVNAWWWVLEAVFIFGAVVFAVLVIVARVVIRVADPPQTKDQKRAVRSYVDKLQRVAENLQTPQFVILFRVVRDTIRPRQDGFIETVAHDSKTLGPDFAALVKLFQ